MTMQNARSLYNQISVDSAGRIGGAQPIEGLVSYQQGLSLAAAPDATHYGPTKNFLPLIIPFGFYLYLFYLNVLFDGLANDLSYPAVGWIATLTPQGIPENNLIGSFNTGIYPQGIIIGREGGSGGSPFSGSGNVRRDIFGGIFTYPSPIPAGFQINNMTASSPNAIDAGGTYAILQVQGLLVKDIHAYTGQGAL